MSQKWDSLKSVVHVTGFLIVNGQEIGYLKNSMSIFQGIFYLRTKNLKNLPPAAFFTIFALSGFESPSFAQQKSTPTECFFVVACLEGYRCFASFLLDDPNPSDFGTRLRTKNLKNLPPAAFFYDFCPLRVRIPFFCTTKKHSYGMLLCCGVLGGIRTPDPLVRSQILYPTELQAHISNAISMIPYIFKNCNTYFLKYFIFYRKPLYFQSTSRYI